MPRVNIWLSEEALYIWNQIEGSKSGWVSEKLFNEPPDSSEQTPSTSRFGNPDSLGTGNPGPSIIRPSQATSQDSGGIYTNGRGDTR